MNQPTMIRASSQYVRSVVLVLCFVLSATERSRCPISDGDWEKKESSCLRGERYHCFENQIGTSVAKGCFKVKLCEEGAHPEEHNGAIICSVCKTGFQPNGRLPSNEFRFSYCESHSSECDTTSGYRECKAPSEKKDRACACSTEHGYAPDPNISSCACFTQNDGCFCRFVGCPPGKVRSGGPHSGICIPPSTTTNGPSTLKKEISTKTVPDKDKKETDSSTATSFPFEAMVILICLGMIGAFGVGCYCVYKKCFKDKRPGNSHTPSKSSSNGTHQNGHVPSPMEGSHQTPTMASGTHPNGDTVIPMQGQQPVNPGHQSGPRAPVTINIVANKVHFSGEMTENTNISSTDPSPYQPPAGRMNDEEEDVPDRPTSPLMNEQTDDGMEETSPKVPLLRASGGDEEETFPKSPAGTPEDGVNDQLLATTLAHGDIEQTLPKVSAAIPEPGEMEEIGHPRAPTSICTMREDDQSVPKAPGSGDSEETFPERSAPTPGSLFKVPVQVHADVGS